MSRLDDACALIERAYEMAGVGNDDLAFYPSAVHIKPEMDGAAAA